MCYMAGDSTDNILANFQSQVLHSQQFLHIDMYRMQELAFRITSLCRSRWCRSCTYSTDACNNATEVMHGTADS